MFIQATEGRIKKEKTKAQRMCGLFFLARYKSDDVPPGGAPGDWKQSDWLGPPDRLGAFDR